VVAGAQELTLIATSGAAAALLRQHAPTLLAALQHGGCKFTVIRIRVQARSAPPRPAKALPKQIDRDTAARLTAAARKLEDPALREALLRLAGRSAGTVARADDPLHDDAESRSAPMGPGAGEEDG